MHTITNCACILYRCNYRISYIKYAKTSMISTTLFIFLIIKRLFSVFGHQTVNGKYITKLKRDIKKKN